MKRFVDIRDANTGFRFAWWDTITDRFETHAGQQAWDDFADFSECYAGNELERYKCLCPAWAFEPIKCLPEFSRASHCS